MRRTRHIITESDMQFSFGKEWIVRRYDEHRFYKSLSGRGLKGVDFIGIWKGEQVVLFEVKNYRIRNHFQPPSDLLNRAGELADTVGKKVEDTYTAIDAIVQYFQRQWLYRMIYPMVKKLPVYNSEWLYWSRVYELMQSKDTCRTVLWLELDNPASGFRQKVEKLLSQDLQTLSHIVNVAETHKHPFMDSLVVDSLIR